MQSWMLYRYYALATQALNQFQRAQWHFKSFFNLLGVKVQADMFTGRARPRGLSAGAAAARRTDQWRPLASSTRSSRRSRRRSGACRARDGAKGARDAARLLPDHALLAVPAGGAQHRRDAGLLHARDAGRLRRGDRRRVGAREQPRRQRRRRRARGARPTGSTRIPPSWRTNSGDDVRYFAEEVPGTIIFSAKQVTAIVGGLDHA
jgi:hypothetical protein